MIRKFKHEPTGYIAIPTMANDKYKIESMPQYTLPKNLVENSKDWIEIFEPKFKNGDVVKFGKAIVLITDYDKCCGYGIDGIGEWKKINTWSFKPKPELWQLATQDEWLIALTKENVKRGFIGNKIKADWISFDGISNYLIDGTFELRFNAFGYQMHKEYYTLMKDGIWAEVVKEETLEELAERYNLLCIEKCTNRIDAFLAFFTENKETIHRLSK